MTCGGSVFKLDIVTSSDRSRSFHRMTDASPFSVLFLFPLVINPSLSSDSSCSFYRITDAPSISPFLFPLIHRPTYVTLSYTLFTLISLRIYCPTRVTLSYTLFSFLSLHSLSNSRHSFIYPFHLSFSSFIVQLASLLHIPFSPFFLLIFIVQLASLLHIPLSPLSLFSDIYLFFKPQSHQPAPALYLHPFVHYGYSQHHIQSSDFYDLLRLFLSPGRR